MSETKVGRPNEHKTEVAWTMRMSSGLLQRVQAAAKRAQVSASEWWRLAAESKLREETKR